MVYALVWICGPSAVVWGDVATWATAAMAAVAGFWAYRAYRAADAVVQIERGRDKATQEREERSQADSIAAWCVDISTVNPAVLGTMVAAVVNRSSQPVFDVRVDMVQGGNISSDYTAPIPVLPPSDGLVHPGGPIEPAPAPRLGPRFTDIHGVRWTRDADGTLTRVPK